MSKLETTSDWKQRLYDLLIEMTYLTCGNSTVRLALTSFISEEIAKSYSQGQSDAIGYIAPK